MVTSATPRTKINDHDFEKALQELQAVEECSFTIALAPGAANTMTITVQAVDGFGVARAGVHAFELYTSTSAAGANISATAYSGTLAATTGAIALERLSKHIFDCLTDANGRFVGVLTDTAKSTGQYICVVKPRGNLVIAGPTVTASYG